MRLSIAWLFIGCFSASFAYGQSFQQVEMAAQAKHLPTKMVHELIDSGARVSIKSTTGSPHYQPGTFGGGTIYLPFASTPLSEWKNGEWSNFYNELFSAWWGNVFVKASMYASDRNILLNDAGLKAKYRRACPSDARLAQEEGYSETVAAVLTWAYPRIQYDPSTGETKYLDVDYNTLYYRKGVTVAAVGHSDRPGYTPEAENTYLDEREYDYLMRWVFGRPAPEIPRAEADE